MTTHTHEWLTVDALNGTTVARVCAQCEACQDAQGKSVARTSHSPIVLRCKAPNCSRAFVQPAHVAARTLYCSPKCQQWHWRKRNRR